MGAESIRTDPARQERWRSTSATSLKSPGCALRLLDDFLVDGLDVRPHAVAVATERVLGEAGLVLRRQLVPDLRLHLVERRAVRRRLRAGSSSSRPCAWAAPASCSGAPSGTPPPAAGSTRGWPSWPGPFPSGCRPSAWPSPRGAPPAASRCTARLRRRRPAA